MKKLILLFITMMASMTAAYADVTVYFFHDHKLNVREMPFAIDGEQAFTLCGEVLGGILASAENPFYKQSMRKVIFKKPGRHVITVDLLWQGTTPYHGETILNLEDNETYYIVLDWVPKGIKLGEVPAKKGMGLVKKAEKGKFTINPDVIYDK